MNIDYMYQSIYIYICSVHALTLHKMKHKSISGNQTEWLSTIKHSEINTNLF